MARTSSGGEQSGEHLTEPELEMDRLKAAQQIDDEGPAHDEFGPDGSQYDEPVDFEPYVEYVGAVGIREVTKDQFAEAGIDDQDTLIWTRESPRVPLSQISEAAQQRLSGEPDFKFVYEEESDDSGEDGD